MNIYFHKSRSSFACIHFEKVNSCEHFCCKSTQLMNYYPTMQRRHCIGRKPTSSTPERRGERRARLTLAQLDLNRLAESGQAGKDKKEQLAGLDWTGLHDRDKEGEEAIKREKKSREWPKRDSD